MAGYTIIDVDTHVTEVADLWSERLPKHLRDLGPRVQTDDRGRDWWMIGGKRTVPIGIEHGTVGILARDRVMYEITTFRKDVETDGRHAVVAFANTIEEDLARRDFTVNAIAWHPLREVYCDPYSGTTDLRDGVLRTVGVAEERFREDYLRILRALRFAGRFEFEIADEGGHRFVDTLDAGRMPALEVVVAVPAAGEDLHEAHALFDQAAGHQALASEGGSLLVIEAVALADVFGLAVD